MLPVLKIIKAKNIDIEKLNGLGEYEYEHLVHWMIKYQSPSNEESLFKNIPNDAYNKYMVDMFRSVASRTASGNLWKSADNYKVSYRLKGRGPRKPYKQSNPHVTSNLRHENSQTFALYRHHDYAF